MIKIVNLLGGLLGGDGWIDSRGMLVLADQLNEIPGVSVTSYPWDNWTSAAFDVAYTDGQVAVIGYSGGGSRATWLANYVEDHAIALMIVFDPSPADEMRPIGANVAKAICFHNNNPMMLGLGGGVLTAAPGGPVIEAVPVSEQHMFVQFDQNLRDQTIAAVKAL